jgi:hypothetical protein
MRNSVEKCNFGLSFTNSKFLWLERENRSSSFEFNVNKILYNVSLPRGTRDFFSSPEHPDKFWGPSSLLYSGYQRLFPWGKAAEA